MHSSGNIEIILDPDFLRDQVATLVISEVYPGYPCSPRGFDDFWLANPIDLNIVAAADGEVCGAVGLEVSGETMWLQYLAVEKLRQRVGIGSMLVRASEELSLDSGCRRLRVISTEAAVPFYLSVGFTAISPCDTDLEKLL